jgi:hypothetical protein
MAQENVGINITVGGNQDQALGSLKAQLREATAEVTKLSEQFGASSKEAVNAAKRAAELKDQIGDAKSLIDAFNPDAKFKALTASLSGVAGGFSALQGATALFGKENEDLEKTLLKVQSAMALSQGLQAVGESIDSFKQLGTVIKTQVVSAFSTLRGAVIATGLGALAVVIGLVIANFDKVKQAVLNMFPGLGKLASFIGNTINAFTDLIGVTNAVTRAEQQRQAVYNKAAAGTKVVNEGIDRQIKLLQAQGAEQGKIDALKKQSIQNELNDLKKAANERGILFGEQSKKYKDLQNDLKIIDATAQKSREDAAKQAATKSSTAGNKYAEDTKKKAETDAKERLDAEKEALEKLSELRNQLFLSTFKNENDKKKAELNLAFIKEKDDILANTKITEATRNELILTARTKLNTDLDALALAEKEKQATADAKLLEDSAVKMQKEDEDEFSALSSKIKTLNKISADGKEADLKIDKIAAEQKIALAQQSAQALTALSDIVGKETAAGKALAVSAALINTYLGITAGVKLGFPAAIPAVAIAAATGFSAVKNIIATKVPGGASSGGAGNMTAPNVSALAPMAPAQPQAATTNISTQSINALGNQAIRSYVVESDVTSNQQRIAAIQQRARFG